MGGRKPRVVYPGLGSIVWISREYLQGEGMLRGMDLISLVAPERLGLEGGMDV